MRTVRGEDEAAGGTKRLLVDFSQLSVFVAMPTNRDLPIQTVHSLLEMQSTANSVGLRCHIHFDIGCSLPEVTRSACAHAFLKTEYAKLFWIDSDMQWSAEAFLHMVALSTTMDVICGSYPAKSEPLVFQLTIPDDNQFNEYGCIPCYSGGLGFTIVDREVIERLAAGAPLCTMPSRGNTQEPMRHIFRTGMINGEIAGEDSMFFYDVRQLGYEVWCDPRVWLGHVGAKVYEGSLYEQTFGKRDQGDGAAVGVRPLARKEVAPEELAGMD